MIYYPPLFFRLIAYSWLQVRKHWVLAFGPCFSARLGDSSYRALAWAQKRLGAGAGAPKHQSGLVSQTPPGFPLPPSPDSWWAVWKRTCKKSGAMNAHSDTQRFKIGSQRPPKCGPSRCSESAGESSGQEFDEKGDISNLYTIYYV